MNEKLKFLLKPVIEAKVHNPNNSDNLETQRTINIKGSDLEALNLFYDGLSVDYVEELSVSQASVVNASFRLNSIINAVKLVGSPALAESLEEIKDELYQTQIELKHVVDKMSGSLI